MKDLVERIKGKYSQVLEQIAASARRSGRDPKAIRLVVVSKAQPLEVVEAAVQAGIRRFGENYPEEAIEKIHQIKGAEQLEWHMIGHLQSRKVRLAAGAFHYLHSLDSLHLASKLNAALVEKGLTLPVLLEMNVSGEGSKYGWPAWDEGNWDGLLSELEQLAQFSRLRTAGLMAMPPLFNNPEEARPYFASLSRLRDYLAGK